MQTPNFTKEIITPIGQHKVVIKTMLTGAEREEVNNAQMDFVKTNDGQTFEVQDMKKVAVAEKHKLISLSVVTIDNDPTDTLSRIQKMWEKDSDFVYNEIINSQKKAQKETQAE